MKSKIKQFAKNNHISVEEVYIGMMPAAIFVAIAIFVAMAYSIFYPLATIIFIIVVFFIFNLAVAVKNSFLKLFELALTEPEIAK